MDDKNKDITKIKDMFWKALFLLYIVFIIYLSVSKPIINYSSFKGEDKIVHFVSYFLGADLFFTAFFKNSKRSYFILFLIFFLLVPILTEYAQKFSIYHTYSNLDMVASYLGAVCGLLFFVFKYKAFN
jgi:VanZ family protein